MTFVLATSIFRAIFRIIRKKMSEYYDSLDENDEKKSLSTKRSEADSTLVPYYTGSKSLQSFQLDDLKILSKLSTSKSHKKNENRVSSSTAPTSASAYSFDLDETKQKSRPPLMPRVKNYKSNLLLRTNRKSYLEQFRNKIGLSQSDGSIISETARSVFGDSDCDRESVHDLVEEGQENEEEGSDTESLFYQKLIANIASDMTKMKAHSIKTNRKKDDMKHTSEDTLGSGNSNEGKKDQKKMVGKRETRYPKKYQMMAFPKRLGGLGPDLEAIKPKMELRKKQLEYGIAASSRNQQILSRMKATKGAVAKGQLNKNNGSPTGGGESTSSVKGGGGESARNANPTASKAAKDYAIRGRRIVKSSGDAASLTEVDKPEEKISNQTLISPRCHKESGIPVLIKGSPRKVIAKKQNSHLSMKDRKNKNVKAVNSKKQSFKSPSMDDEILKTLSERHSKDVILARSISKSLCPSHSYAQSHPPLDGSKPCLALDSFAIESS